MWAGTKPASLGPRDLSFLIPQGGLFSSNECGQHFFSEARAPIGPSPAPGPLILDSLSPSPCSGSKITAFRAQKMSLFGEC